MYEISLFPRNAGADQTKFASKNYVVTDLQEFATAIELQPWAPAIYRDMYRANANVSRIDTFVVDVDKGCTLEQALKIFAPYKHIIGTSKSHQKEKVKDSGAVEPACDRFRVVLFPDQPATSDAEFKSQWFAAFKLWPFIDPQCKNGSRFYYPCTEIVSINEDGLPFNDRITLNASASPLPPKKSVGGIARGKISKATKDFLIDGAPAGEWHGRFFKAAMDFKEQSFDIDEARMKLTAVTGHLDATDEQQLEDVYANRPAKYSPRGVANKMRDVLLKSKCIVDVSDPSYCLLFHPETGDVTQISPQIITQILGNKDQALYRENNFIYARFDYDRFGDGPLQPDEKSEFIYNTYQPPEWQAAHFYFKKPLPAAPAKLPEIYDSFFTHLTGGDDESKSYLVDWLATAMQSRNYTLLTALGEPGVGKGVLGEIMERMFGEHNFVRTRDEIFKNKFNGQLRNKALVYIDEVALKGADDHNRLKDIVNDKIEVEQKGKDATYIKNSASYYLSSNQLDAVKPDAGDRRFSIIQLTDTKLNATPLIGRLKEMMLPENIGTLALYLKSHKVTRDMLTPFFSARSDDVKEAGLTDWEAYVIFEWTADNEGREIPIRELQDSILNRFGKFRSPPGRRKIEELRRKYPEYLQITRSGNSRKIRVLGSPDPTVKPKINIFPNAVAPKAH